MSDYKKSLSSARYRVVGTMTEIRRRGERAWRDKDGQWSVIPQTYRHVHRSAGDFVLTRYSTELARWRAVCSLHLRKGERDADILSGREAGGDCDWLLVQATNDREGSEKWRLMQRGRSRLNGNRDGVLDGQTTGSRLERLIEAALVTLDFDFDGHPDMSGRPDFFVRDVRTAIYAHGCRQHAHGCPRGRAFGRQLTGQEAAGVRRHDQRAADELRRAGMNVLTVWECAVTGGRQPYDGERFVERLNRFLRHPPPEMAISG
jgi:G:T-mismatch repair DNA endonuclease (very short patch repair protein)